MNQNACNEIKGIVLMEKLERIIVSLAESSKSIGEIDVKTFEPRPTKGGEVNGGMPNGTSIEFLIDKIADLAKPNEEWLYQINEKL